MNRQRRPGSGLWRLRETPVGEAASRAGPGPKTLYIKRDAVEVWRRAEEHATRQDISFSEYVTQALEQKESADALVRD
jgi:hypothetical protein